MPHCMSNGPCIPAFRRRTLYDGAVSDAFLDRLAGPEKQRVLKRLRSPEAYERLREKVKGPEDLEWELDRAEKLAELHFALESDEAAHDSMKAIVDRALRERPDDAVEDAAALPASVKEGNYRLAVSADDELAILPEGNVRETIPVTTALLEECLSQLSASL